MYMYVCTVWGRLGAACTLCVRACLDRDMPLVLVYMYFTWEGRDLVSSTGTGTCSVLFSLFTFLCVYMLFAGHCGYTPWARVPSVCSRISCQICGNSKSVIG